MSVINMIMNELKHMVVPCLISAPLIVLVRFLIYKKTGVFDRKREALMLVFWIYITAVFSVTLIPVSGDFRNFSLNLPDFSTLNRESLYGWILWKITLRHYADLIRNIVGNVVVFILYSIMFPLLFKDKAKYTVLYGILFSVFIEFLQLFTERQTDLYDIFMNSVGIVIGYLIYLLFKRIASRR